ncbi:uncharacterized protein LOC105020288 isoform X2 [Esox lucius]|uniref:Kit ligand n=1 Tax=Esox lucius TaxID=8010 RepID=A0AAY5K3K4_ESOLU|nr:uncharacterized protein LOC105020288 isoform X2 [Esox lucius]
MPSLNRSRVQIRTTTCVILFLLTSFGICSGGFGNPVTDDVSRLLLLLKNNIPKDYKIPINHIPKNMSGVCWFLLNIYPLEQSLRELAQVFGAISSNKDNIMLFITMLQNLRFKFDHEELEVTMQMFKCHYREVKWPTGQYFDYVRAILNSAGKGKGGFRCAPPPCPAPSSAPGSEAQDHDQTRSRGSLLCLLLIPVTACVFLIVWVVKSRTGGSPEMNQQILSSDVERASTIPIPLQQLTSPSDVPVTGSA